MQRDCDACGQPYVAKRPSSKYCSDTCRVRASRGASAPKSVSVSSRVSAQVRAELESAEMVETSLGQMALTLAGRMDAGGETANGLTALSKELRSLRDEILRSGARAADPLDELNRRRLAKLGS